MIEIPSQIISAGSDARTAVTAVSVMMAMQKIQFVGTYARQISSLLVSLPAGVLVVALILVIIRWLVKSLIVRYAGNSGSSWSFRTAASVTGYATSPA